jgi:protein-tyrosine phosphatase
MIDLHNHILPELDDGAQSLADSLEMAKLAVNDGIQYICATPHHRDGYYTNEKSRVLESIHHLQRTLDDSQIPLTVLPGQEVHCNDTLIDDLYAQEQIATLNNSRYLLLEFDPSEIPANIEEIMHEFRVLRIVPIIAHPERNKRIARDPEQLVNLIKMGALAQVTSQSIVGKFGRKVQHIALELCRRNLIHIVASDAHNVRGRPFVMKEGYEVIREQLGESYVDYYMNNAKSVIDNIEIEIKEPTRRRKGLLCFWQK